jgi:hypothetical protein
MADQRRAALHGGARHARYGGDWHEPDQPTAVIIREGG